ncbi:hypothetical protein POM88_046334 [Heracleum sosnowskyi]|uniref:Uncharacterized protein n=1 Tax=Heracleum sosnowskyi TaxID=360622 RepID=A0AAD8M4K5_9APIA|nr:hypothetical protein POM88_046334 [Heracleum sosnowskyi]
MIFFLVSYYQTNYVADVPIVPQSLVGMPTYLPGQVDAMHPFRMHQQAVTHSGLKVAVASSADRIKVDANLVASGLQLSMFDAIVSADAFENLKPAPDIFFLAASMILDVLTDEIWRLVSHIKLDHLIGFDSRIVNQFVNEFTGKDKDINGSTVILKVLQLLLDDYSDRKELYRNKVIQAAVLNGKKDEQVQVLIRLNVSPLLCDLGTTEQLPEGKKVIIKDDNLLGKLDFCGTVHASKSVYEILMCCKNKVFASDQELQKLCNDVIITIETTELTARQLSDFWAAILIYAILQTTWRDVLETEMAGLQDAELQNLPALWRCVKIGEIGNEVQNFLLELHNSVICSASQMVADVPAKVNTFTVCKKKQPEVMYNFQTIAPVQFAFTGACFGPADELIVIFNLNFRQLTREERITMFGGGTVAEALEQTSIPAKSCNKHWKNKQPDDEQPDDQQPDGEQPDGEQPDDDLYYAKIFAKTRKRKPGRKYQSNPDVMEFRIDTINKKLGSSEGLDGLDELVSGAKKSHGRGWLIGRHDPKCLKTSTSAPAPTDSYVQELTKKIRQEVAVEVEAKVNQKVCAEVDGKINRKVQDNLTLALKKLAEANPTLNVDIGEICATISSDTVGDGTPMTNGPSS